MVAPGVESKPLTYLHDSNSAMEEPGLNSPFCPGIANIPPLGPQIWKGLYLEMQLANPQPFSHHLTMRIERIATVTYGSLGAKRAADITSCSLLTFRDSFAIIIIPAPTGD